MGTKTENLLKLLNVEVPDDPAEKRANDLILELLKSDQTVTFPRPDQIKITVEEAQVLFNNNINLAFYATKSFKVFIGQFGLEQEDFDQIVLHSLWCGALTYDISKKCKFSTWCFLIARQHTAREITRNYVRPGRIGQTIILKNDNGEVVELTDIVDFKELPILDKVIAHEILDTLYKHNNARDAEILVERLVWDMTLEECGINRQLTKERIRQLEKRGLQRLKATYHSGRAKFIH